MLPPRTQFGFSLLEVLIALLVLSIGLLAHFKVQALGVRASADANLRTEATFLVNDMVERMRANRPAADSGYYAGIDYAAIDCSTAPAKICSAGAADTPPGIDPAEGCTTEQMADEDAIRWFCSARDALPGANVAVSSAAGVYSIQVSWNGLDEDGNAQTRNVSASFIP
jgi:type IV pilus assembly protein PilV